MYCSACGHALEAGQPVCPQCGRPVAAPVPPVPAVPNLGFELQTYAGRIRALSIVWFVYGGLSLLLAFVGVGFMHAFFMGNFIPWAPGPGMMGPWFAKFILPLLIGRSVLALLAGWGLMERTQWGRVVAIVAAFASLIRIPIGTALGIWTLVTLLGYRNSTLYEQL